MKQTDLEKLLADMSLKEKVDQMLQLSGAFYLGDENSVLTGPANDMGIGKEDLEMAGSILGAAGKNCRTTIWQNSRITSRCCL